ncbi:MAG TPA: hypothetical protein VFQ77_14825 [Pseudonocardiaceae bacterium]|nr:hypothetical protein [Pseudonocardiaceae bacterium]
MDENRQSYVYRTAGVVRGLSTNQFVIVILVPGLITALEHVIYEGWSTWSLTAIFTLVAVVAVIVLAFVNRYLVNVRERSELRALARMPGYPERRWPVVALTVGPYATSVGKAEGGGLSPTPELLAIDRILSKTNPRRAILVHSSTTRDQAEELVRQKGLEDSHSLVEIDPFGDMRQATEKINAAIKSTVDELGLEPRNDVIIDVTGGLVSMSLAGYLASEMAGCAAHVRATPNRRVNGMLLFDTTKAQSILLNFEPTA